MRYCVFDLETGTKSFHKRKANPWYNEVVAVGIKKQGLPVQSYYFHEGLNSSFWNGSDILIGHNIKFDLLYIWKYSEFQAWLAQGGKIFDTQLAEYMLTGQKSQYSALRDIAANKYGCPERTKFMEEYWDKGIDTCDIPKELVIQDVESDVLDTEAIMLQQINQAQKEGMYNLIMESMEGLLATTEMEYNGIFINRQIMEDNTKILEQELETLHRDCLEVATKHWDSKELNLNSPTQISILFFGGKIKIKIPEPILNELGIEDRVKSGPNRGKIKTKLVEREQHIKGLGLKPEKDWETKKAGTYETNEKILKIISGSKRNNDAVEIAKLLLQIREKEKLLGTYFIGFRDLIYPDGCIRGSLNHVSTDTGRTSSTKPNLQNVSN